MDIRYQYILLSFLLALLMPTAYAQTNEQVIVPDIDRRILKADSIDSENIEIGIHYGLISIEDFDSTETIIGRLAWHISQNLFFEGSYSTAKGDRTSYEQITGGLPLFTDDQRDFTQYNLSLGWNVLSGQSFLSKRRSVKSDFYLIAGAGSTEFLDDKWFTVTAGAGYRVFLNDFLAIHIDVRDHIFDRDIFGEEETTNNVELSTGLSFFF